MNNLYDSKKEIKYFCQRGGPTIEGSTPISELPTLKEQDYMYALKQKHKDELVLVRVDGNLCDIYGEIKWFRYYLEAEEFCHKCTYDVEAIEASEILKYILNELSSSKNRVHQLLTEIIGYQKQLNPDLEDYDASKFNHIQSMEGYHHDEED